MSRRLKVVQVTGSAHTRSYYYFVAAANSFASRDLIVSQIGLTWAPGSACDHEALSADRLWWEHLETPQSNQP